VGQTEIQAKETGQATYRRHGEANGRPEGTLRELSSAESMSPIIL